MYQYIPAKGTQKGDVYAFGIILYEIFGRSGPYGETCLQPKDIIAAVIAGEIQQHQDKNLSSQPGMLKIS